LLGSDARKLVTASQLSKRTGVQQGWVAELLRMKSAANVSQQLRWLRDETRPMLPSYLAAADKLSEFFD